jgi:hypothetical protein
MSEGTKAARRFLVLGRVGDNSLHKTWIADTSCERTWDLQLNAYGKDEERVQDGDLETVIDRGTKWDSIARHFRARPELLDNYDYIMLPDDDILIGAGDINRLFDIVTRHNLTMAQPSMSLASYISWPILLNVPQFELRYTNFLESMACCIKTSYLKRLLPMFEQHFTGWGTDLIWTMMMDDPAYKAAIVDAVVMTHTRPLYSGPIYDTFAKDKVDPRREVVELTGSFDNMPGMMLVYGGILANGKKIDAASTLRRNGLSLVAQSTRSKLPFNTLRMGVAMIARSFTKATYRPQKLHLRPESKLATLLDQQPVT